LTAASVITERLRGWAGLHLEDYPEEDRAALAVKRRAARRKIRPAADDGRWCTAPRSIAMSRPDPVRSLMRAGYARISVVDRSPATRVSPATPRAFVVAVLVAGEPARVEELSPGTPLLFDPPRLGFSRAELVEDYPLLPRASAASLPAAAVLALVAPALARRLLLYLRARATLAASIRAGVPG